MFEFIDKATVEQALPAGHEAIQFIRQWAFAAVQAGRSASLEGLPPRQVELAKRIVAEIEDREGRPVTQISEARVGEYIKLVSERLQALSRKQFPVGQINGQDLLGKLRSVK